MNPAARLCLWAGVTTLILSGALISSRSTRSIIQTQFNVEALASGMRDDPKRLMAVADANPADWRLQLGRALITRDAAGLNASEGQINRLAFVAARFPNEPVLTAILLRAMVDGRIHVHEPMPVKPRAAQVHGPAVGGMMPGMPAPRSIAPRVPAAGRAGSQQKPGVIAGVSSVPPPAPEHPRTKSVRTDIARVEAAAVRGASLDPDNAYFPVMRATALLAAGRDPEAWEAVMLAGRCSRWQDYAIDEPDALYRLQLRTFGERSQAIRVTTYARTRFGHFALARAMARVTSGRAGQLERAGRMNEAAALRHALMRIGGLMRSDQRNATGVIVGIAVMNIGMAAPGGITHDWHKLYFDAAERLRQARNGNLPTHLSDPTAWIRAARRTEYTAYLRAHGFHAEAIWAEAEQARSAEARRILQLGLQSFDSVVPNVRGASYSWLTGLALLSSWLIVMMLSAGRAICSRFAGRCRALVLALVGCAALCTGLWQFYAASAALEGVQILAAPAAEVIAIGPGAEEVNFAPPRMAMTSFAVGVVFAPALMLAALSRVFSRWRRSPGDVGRGIVMPATAAALLVLYGCSVVVAAASESAVQRYQDTIVNGEPQAAAESLHVRWPGPPPP